MLRAGFCTLWCTRESVASYLPCGVSRKSFCTEHEQEWLNRSRAHADQFLLATETGQVRHYQIPVVERMHQHARWRLDLGKQHFTHGLQVGSRRCVQLEESGKGC